MSYKITVRGSTYSFKHLKELLAKASPLRSADVMAGLAARSQTERVVAQLRLSEVPLIDFLHHPLIDPKHDEVSRLIEQQFDEQSFAILRHHTVGSFREWLLLSSTTTKDLSGVQYALTPEMVAATSKIMRNQDLIAVAQKCEVVTKFRTTMGLKGHLGVRLQPNHPTDSEAGILASIIDGLSLAAGDALIGINPASDNPATCRTLFEMVEKVRDKFAIPTQCSVLTHVTTQMELIKQGAPVDLVFQSIAGTEAANKSFGINLALLKEAHEMALEHHKADGFKHVMYFETGQGSALSASAHHGIDAQTCEARAYAVAREYKPFLVNTVVGFIGPEYLYDGKQIIRAGLEDHFCGKLLGVPMGCDVCYTNHAQADQNDMDILLTSLGVAGCSFVMGVPGADDIMLNYQSTSFHDALYLRSTLGLKPAPEFFSWLQDMSIMDEHLLIQEQPQKLLAMVDHEL